MSPDRNCLPMDKEILTYLADQCYHIFVFWRVSVLPVVIQLSYNVISAIIDVHIKHKKDMFGKASWGW